MQGQRPTRSRQTHAGVRGGPNSGLAEGIRDGGGSVGYGGGGGGTLKMYPLSGQQQRGRPHELRCSPAAAAPPPPLLRRLLRLLRRLRSSPDGPHPRMAVPRRGISRRRLCVAPAHARAGRRPPCCAPAPCGAPLTAPGSGAPQGLRVWVITTKFMFRWLPHTAGQALTHHPGSVSAAARPHGALPALECLPSFGSWQPPSCQRSSGLLVQRWRQCAHS